ncbi:MAG: hypothetical protein JWO72_1186 [Caulobacteraceae bacterium]|nr:hypothetical protein [Caulobacteraceae bacterium]
MNWEKRAARCLRVEMARRGVKFPTLAKLMADNGHPVTAQSLRNKVSRGSFSAGFLLEALTLLRCEAVHLDRLGDDA